MAEYHNCPNCGQPIGADDRLCSNCGQPLERRPLEEPIPSSPPTPPQPPQPPPPAAEVLRYVPWEDRQKVGFFKALWETWKESVFYPNRFFSRAPYSGGLASPMLYAVIVVWVSYAINQLTGLLLSSFTIGFIANMIHDEQLLESLGLLGGLGFLQVLGILVLLPFMIIAALFIGSGIYHLILMIFGWNKRNFEATFRAISYGVGPLIFMIVPACGSLIGYVWVLVLTILGIKHLQKTTGGQASFVVLLPLILCCCLIALLAAFFGAAIMALIQGAMSGGYYYD